MLGTFIVECKYNKFEWFRLAMLQSPLINVSSISWCTKWKHKNSEDVTDLKFLSHTHTWSCVSIDTQYQKVSIVYRNVLREKYGLFFPTSSWLKSVEHIPTKGSFHIEMKKVKIWSNARVFFGFGSNVVFSRLLRSMRPSHPP